MNFFKVIMSSVTLSIVVHMKVVHNYHHIRLFVAWQNACFNNRNVKNVHITYHMK